MFTGDSVTVTAHHGGNASGQSQGAAGTGSANTIHFNGGAGANGTSGTNKGGGGAGSSAGTGSAGASGAASSSTVGGAGGTAPSGGGNGGDGGSSTTVGVNGTVPGGGGGGGGDNGSHAGGTGAAGQISITYTATTSGTATLAGTGTLTATGSAFTPGAYPLPQVLPRPGWLRRFGLGRHQVQPGRQLVTISGTAALAGTGTLTATGGLPNPACVNQWAGVFTQPTVFGTTPPALQSLVIALNTSTSVGGGSGTPTAGNWLFCLTGWNQSGLPAATAGVGDDIHSFWRPGNESTSTWAVSTSSGNTRASIWYTPNLARTAGDVYVAPNGAMAGQACLVVEIQGLGPWDTVTGIATSYAAGATSLNLPLSAPAAAGFTIAAVCGDSSAAGQAFAPASWTALSTVTATNGVDHTCDAVLTSAFLPSTTGSLSVNGTATSAADLSGVILQVRVTGQNPIPATQNPNWPYTRFEAGFGSGFQTPQDSITWTDLTTRLYSWNETTGIQYQLGSIQATEVELELDNFDGALSSDNPSSPYYGSIKTGVPLRLRMALGTIGGTVVNRWYVIQRNAEQWPQQIDPNYRRKIAATATDIWSTLSASGPTPYRGEIEQDSPYAWWPMDDQALPGGVQPTSLRNAASGNTATLAVTASPAGVTSQDAYGLTGADLTTGVGYANSPPPPSVATYAVGQQQGWMYGDPQSSPQSYSTGNPVTANPGSAAWQQAGALGTGGSSGWFLAVNDPGFPALSAGVTVKGWFSAGFFGTGTGWEYLAVTYTQTPACGHPYSPISLCTLSTGTAPVAVLQLDRATGHLNLITYHGTTPTSNSIYTGSDLRCASWVSVDIQLTATTWKVLVNGGLTANVSGTATGMTSAWTWLTLNGDYGTAGGTSPASIQNGGNVAYSHWAVFGSQLPAWRLAAHYCAAVTGFGLLPAPQALTVTPVLSVPPSGAPGSYTLTPDGTENDGAYGGPSPPSSISSLSSYTFSAVAVAQAGSYTSGPSARATTGGVGGLVNNLYYGNAIWVGFTVLAPSAVIYTASAANAETGAATVCGSGDSFTSGYGAAASGHGTCQTAAGTGANPPASASALGDGVQQRIERILGYGNATYPGRCIDPAALQVQAATDIGGQQTGPNVQNITQSDGGMLYIDNLGSVCYLQKSHLASQYSSPVWTIGPASTPYYKDIQWTADPQRVFNAILITPFSPDGASLADIVPSQASQVNASQAQYGAQPHAITSYLQSQSEMQTYADFLFSNYGQVQIRADNVRIDAAPYPAAFELVLGVNVGDVVNVTNWQIGGGGITGTFRVSRIRRTITFGGNDGEDAARAEVILQCDYEPPTQWS